MALLQPPAIERLPDDLLLHILNYVSDIKSLGLCAAVSRRFRLLLPLVSSLLIPVDCVDFSSGDSNYPFSPAALLGRGSPVSTDDDRLTALYLAGFTCLSSVIRWSVHRLLKSLGFNSSLPLPLPLPLPIPNPPFLSASSVTHQTLVPQVLENFSDLRTLRIRLPSGELSLNDSSSASSSTLLRWRAHFGSSLSRCLILAAAAADSSSSLSPRTGSESAVVAVADNDTIADSFYTKLGGALIISTLFVASKRRCLLRPIISEHATLESVVLTDADGQGLLRMDRDQLEDLRKNPISSSWKSKTMIPAFIRMWYAPVVELSCGVLLKGATLVAVRPISGGEKEEEDMGLGWIEEEFDGEDGDGMYAEAVRILVKEGRTHYMEMKSLSDI